MTYINSSHCSSSKISTHTPLAGRDKIFFDKFGRLSNFYSHAPRGTWRRICEYVCSFANFYSHAPRGTWLEVDSFYQFPNHFYSHAPRGTWHGCLVDGQPNNIKFLLTRPSRDVTVSINKWYIYWFGFLLTRPSRDVTHTGPVDRHNIQHFYSHAPRGTWRDKLQGILNSKDFYSHAPRGTWLRKCLKNPGHHGFLLTRPSRDVTDLSPVHRWSSWFLLTRPSRDVTFFLDTPISRPQISTHTPLAGRDIVVLYSLQPVKKFLLTRPSRDVTILYLLKSCAYKFLLTRPSRDVTDIIPYYPRASKFLLTRPSRDVTGGRCISFEIWQFLLTRAARGVSTHLVAHNIS